MLLERSQAMIGLIAAVVLGVGTVFAVALSGGLFKPGMQLTAEFEDAAGLRSGSFVFVAGVRTGEVLSVEIDEERALARARFTLQSDGVPADSEADIILQNTLGKRAIRLTPGDSSEFLADGDEIPIERTGTPIDLPELGDRSAALLGEVNVTALQDLMTSLADITEDKREDVTTLLDGLERVSRIVDERKDEIRVVIQRAEDLVDAAAEKDREIVRIIDSVGTTLDTLVRRRADVERLLEETARTTTLTADLLEDRRAQIDRVLFELHEDLEIVDAHQVDLAHVFAYMGVGVDGFASIGYTGGEAKLDNPAWGNVFTTGLGSVGIDALFGCGGTFDELFTEIIGPDPNCEGGPNTGDTGGDDGGGSTEASAADHDTDLGGATRFLPDPPTAGGGDGEADAAATDGWRSREAGR